MSHWISLHVFYGKEQRTLLLECFTPALQNLVRQQAIKRYFFVRYWEGGPHVRLRVVPIPGAEEAVKALLEARICAFLRERPVFFEMPEGSQVWARRNFVLEYGEDELYRKYGPEGIIPTYPENTFHYITYEPEYERYGGAEGMEISERHFHVASETALHRLTWDNMHVKGVRLAQAITLMLGLCYAFLETDEAVAIFMRGYATSWYIRFLNGKPDGLASGTMARAELALPAVSDRITKLSNEFRTGNFNGITAADAEWNEHGKHLKNQLKTMINDGRVAVPDRFADTRAQSPLMRHLIPLLFSYIHMMNNRLGIAITEEVSMAYLIYRSLGLGSATA